MDNYYSGYLEDFLAFLTAVEEQNRMSGQDLDETNLNLQDLQHFIEFGQAGGKEMLKVYKLYKQIRHKRRIAKENLEQCAPVMEWIDKNRRTIQDLRALLGKIRKIEQSQSNRIYIVRTDILNEVTSLSSLPDRSEEVG